MKVSELKQFLKDHPEITLDDLVDDETGKPLKDLRASQKAYTQETQKRATLETELKQRDATLAEMRGQLTQAAQYQQQVVAQADQARRQAAAQGVDWKSDPLYQPVAAYYDAELQKAQAVIAQLAQGYAGMMQQYQTDRTAFLEIMNRNEVREMKRQYADFDEEQVRAIAQQHNIPTWDGAYKAWKAESLPAALETARTKGRQEGIKEAEAKLSAPATEMGTTGAAAAAPSVGEAQTKNWGEAWKGLVTQLETAGVVR